MKIAVLALIVLAALALGYTFFFQPLIEPTEPRRRMKVEGEVALLEQVVSALSYETNLAANSKLSLTNDVLNNSAIFAALAARTNGLIDALHPEWAKQQRLTDPWGHDYQFLCITGRDSAGNVKRTLKVRSLGRNGTDDKGSADDITSRGTELNP